MTSSNLISHVRETKKIVMAILDWKQGLLCDKNVSEKLKYKSSKMSTSRAKVMITPRGDRRLGSRRCKTVDRVDNTNLPIFCTQTNRQTHGWTDRPTTRWKDGQKDSLISKTFVRWDMGENTEPTTQTKQNMLRFAYRM